jgi:hypothetical protein
MGAMGVPCRGTVAVDRVVEVQAPLLPLALDRPLRHAAHGGDLGEREPAEELEIDDLGQLRFDLGEFVERITDPDQFLRAT